MLELILSQFYQQEADRWRYGPELPVGIFRAAVVEDTKGGVVSTSNPALAMGSICLS